MHLTSKDNHERKYWWKFEIILKSGEKIEGYDRNEYDNSYDLAKDYLKSGDNQFISLGDRMHTKNIFVRTEEIATVIISAG
jgi:hypothetical protein